MAAATTPPTLSFLGGARTVTGSKFLLQLGGCRVLVDCGLFQGLKELRLRNWAPFPVDARSIAAVVITHAHLDHCGYLPRLVRDGFDGPAYVTPDTAALMRIVLPDSGRLLEEEAEFAQQRGFSRHDPALPLYTEQDALEALTTLQPIDFGTEFEPVPDARFRFDPAGHILGSATVHADVPGSLGVHAEVPGSAGVHADVPTRSAGRCRMRFSGDLGRPSHPLLREPAPPGDVDWIAIESTYGNRVHGAVSGSPVSGEAGPVERLADLISRTVERGGIVVIPAFAVDRTDVLLFHLARLARSGRLPRVPVFVDSPMALAALDVYRESIDRGDRIDVRPDLRGDDDLFEVPLLREVHDADGSRRVSARRDPAVVIAGSGMATGGRVVHHLERFLPDKRNSVALVGFQSAGTRGRSLLDGVDTLKIHGRYVRVRAEICDLTDFSVHADRDDLLAWLQSAERPPHGIFVVHGEEPASLALRNLIRDRLDWTAVVPGLGEKVVLNDASAPIG